MRRFAVLYFIAVSALGQTGKPMPFERLTHAEDSPASLADNQISYGNPRGLEPKASEPAGAISAAGTISPARTISPAGTISVEQLQHPLSRKGARLLRQAQNFVAIGDHGKAIAELQLALKERSAIPYANSLLGSEYLRINQVPAAIEALEQAVKLLPRNAANHSNLGYALFLLGHAERAEQEVQRALELDRNNQTTRHVLSIVTHGNKP
jgi:tetratricopeptide (TPR) repeat protein